MFGYCQFQRNVSIINNIIIYVFMGACIYGHAYIWAWPNAYVYAKKRVHNYAKKHFVDCMYEVHLFLSCTVHVNRRSLYICTVCTQH